VRDGVWLWLDASAQRSARQSAGLPSIGHLQPVDSLLDASGNQRHARQLAPDRRPAFHSDGEVAFLKFDGKDDFLSIAGPPEAAAELTIFVIAAPRTNAGAFSAFFGAARAGQNDYTSGLNFDFGPQPTKELSVLNVESAGATGFRDLLIPGFFNAIERPFGDFHIFTVRSRVGKTEVFLDGFKGGERDRADSTIGLDNVVVGARLFSNDGTQPPYAQGFFNGAIAEVLVYNRALSDEERRAVEQALMAKLASLHGLLHGSKGHALEAVKDPPIVQMLVPGFSVSELPLKLVNLNNVRYRHDGKVVAMGYDGRVHLLSDTDSDGVEDKSELFWDTNTLRAPVGIGLTPKDDPRGDGVFVASKGKVSLILDTNRDGKADEEKIIASGWRELPHGVDTLGLAVDSKDGAVFFGLGCANFVDAYQIDRTTGRSRYDLNEIHGTIQRISADFSKRETICTGVRFTCALAFNRDGELFATDQEGATWLPNGNPLDELLHIQRGKHYGFPPRHPKHLPNVIDEPPVIEYGPQHQSTVGMVFNDSVNGGATFGPAHWAGDALVCGASRGKIWRTKLAKTPLGYVAQNYLIACLGLLAIDACVTPEGDLLVACHSGPPDWGTGPGGEGRIFKIRYTGRDLPQPVTAWAAAPDEFRVAFDRPLKLSDWAGAQKQVKIEAGAHVAAGDRFEVIRPGYQIVRDQITTPRRWVEVLGLSLSEDHRTIVLRIPRQTAPANYAVTLPVPEPWRQRSPVAQHPQMDLLVTLNGLAASVASGDSQERRCVLPHPSAEASAVLTKGSSEHEAFLKSAQASDAILTLRGRVDVSNPFVPVVQPGSKVDWDIAGDSFSSATFGVHTTDGEVNLEKDGTSKSRLIKPLTIKAASLKHDGVFLRRETLRHPLSTARICVPWAAESAPGKQPELARARTDVKGHWLRGRRVFFSDAGCATCHTIRGEGMAFGPDLSNLIHRDRESVLHDIVQPSATINPDHAGSLVQLADGVSHAGLVRAMDGTKVALALPAGAHLELPRATVTAVEPLKTSLMPVGLTENLDATQIEDLLTFLLTDPLEPAPITRVDPPVPPARGLSEVTRVLDAAPAAANSKGTLRILLCAGPKDHGPDEHDYPLWLDRWSRLLQLGENVTVTTSMGFPTTEQLSKSDVAVFYNANPGWDAAKAKALDEFHRRGGGVVYIHYAADGGKDPDGVAERAGLAFTLGSKFRHGEFDLVFSNPEHPITRGFLTLHFTDETYWNMRGDAGRLNVLGISVEDSAPRPELWTLERHRSRIVACIPGHYTWTFDDPLFRILVLRSICWAAKEVNVDRLADLALIGARVAP
jgi:putative heme-binding domain-containing protein